MTNVELMEKIEQLLEKNAALEIMLAVLMREIVALTKENKALLEENAGRTMETVRIIKGDVGRLRKTVGLMKEKEALQRALWEEKITHWRISLN